MASYHCVSRITFEMSWIYPSIICLQCDSNCLKVIFTIFFDIEIHGCSIRESLSQIVTGALWNKSCSIVGESKILSSKTFLIDDLRRFELTKIAVQRVAGFITLIEFNISCFSDGLIWIDAKCYSSCTTVIRLRYDLICLWISFIQKYHFNLNKRYNEI